MAYKGTGQSFGRGGRWHFDASGRGPCHQADWEREARLCLPVWHPMVSLVVGDSQGWVLSAPCSHAGKVRFIPALALQPAFREHTGRLQGRQRGSRQRPVGQMREVAKAGTASDGRSGTSCLL